ncbi:transglutaminase-like cysteine peptidase [Anderseniella sp. Alg231-50]|uniref:transglutaminase-like cysteine peptidase n=1 Tax=Anderseniella sp. Alg231-50 TaxID=1922226 RepID=UPI000D5566CF
MPLILGGTGPAFAASSPKNLNRSDATAKVNAGGIFGSLELDTNINLASKHWFRALRKMRKDTALVSSCSAHNRQCRKAVRLLSAIIGQSKHKPVDGNLLDQVNRYVNRHIRYTSDRKVFGRNEYWAGPSEVMGARGDCEDYVIAKYFILSQLGISDKDMKVVVVRDVVSGLGHAVLSVRLADTTMILDNQSMQVRDHLTVSRYQPLYSINRSRAWLNLAVKRVSVSSRLAAKPAPQQQIASRVRLASLHPGIAVHLSKGKPPRSGSTGAGSELSDVHY